MYISKADPGIQDRTSPDRKIKYKDFKWGRLSLTTPSRWFAIQGVYESSKTGFRRLSLSAMGLRPGVPRAHDVKLCWIKHIGKIRLYHTYVLCILYTYIYTHRLVRYPRDRYATMYGCRCHLPLCLCPAPLRDQGAWLWWTAMIWSPIWVMSIVEEIVIEWQKRR